LQREIKSIAISSFSENLEILHNEVGPSVLEKGMKM
jgi:hypothetical protein